MSEAATRNFNDFVLGDDVFELGGGVVRRVAERAGLDVSEGPSSELLHGLVGIVGKNKVLLENEPIDFLTNLGMAWYVDRAGTQLPMSRSLWTPDQQIPEGTPRLITGGVPNWQDRAANYLVSTAEKLTSDVTVYAPVGNRVMDQGSDLKSKNVQAFMEQHDGQHPTERQYAELYVVPALAMSGYDVVLGDTYETGAGEKIAENFVADNPELFAKDQKISFVRVANAGVQLAVQFRKAARRQLGRYDSFKFKPQVYIETDTLPVARSDRQRQDSRNFQAAQTGLRQVLLTAKSLHEAAGGR